MADLPGAAAWLHRDARDGFESVFFAPDGDGWRFAGHTSAVEDGQAWAVQYSITVDGDWCTRMAHVRGWSVSGERELRIEGDGAGAWLVDGADANQVRGCLDVDLESSACTNAMPVRRLRLQVGEGAAAPAMYVRALDLTVERLEQDYVRADDDRAGRQCYEYVAPAFDTACRLVYDRSGLVVDYPGIARRVL
jgi:uncharacterized protein